MTEIKKKVQQYKVEALNKTKELLSGYNDLIFSDFRGLNVEQISELRSKLREINAYYKVIKNSYLRRATKEMEMPDLSEIFIGPTAVTLVNNDPGSAAKVLFNFTKDTTLKIKGALVEGQVFSESDVQALSKLPTRDQLYAQLMGTINAPLTNLMYALNGVILKFIRTLQAVADNKKN